MQISIAVRHGSASENTQGKVRDKVERLTRYFERLTAIEVTINLESREAPKVDLRVSAEHKHDFVASAQADELMAAMDAVVEKMEQQLRKYKEKVQAHHRASGRQARIPSETGTEDA